jgi:hypothetical protein
MHCNATGGCAKPPVLRPKMEILRRRERENRLTSNGGWVLTFGVAVVATGLDWRFLASRPQPCVEGFPPPQGCEA